LRLLLWPGFGNASSQTLPSSAAASSGSLHGIGASTPVLRAAAASGERREATAEPGVGGTPGRLWCSGDMTVFGAIVSTSPGTGARDAAGAGPTAWTACAACIAFGTCTVAAGSASLAERRRV